MKDTIHKKMTKFYSINSKLPLFLSALLCVYYLLPKEVAIAMEFILLLYSFSKRNREKGIANYPVVWYLVFFIFLALINFADFSSSGFNYVTTCVNCFVFVLITYFCIRNENDIKLFIKSFAQFGAVFCLFLIPLILFLGNVEGARLGDAGGANNNAFLSSSISIGYMVTLINLCQYHCMSNKELSSKQRIVFFVLFLFSFYCILLTGTRKALLGSLLFIVIYTFYLNKRQLWKILLYTVFFSVGVYGLYLLTMRVDFLYYTIGMRLEGLIGLFDPNYAEVDASTLAREELINTGWKIFTENPIFGAGISESQRILAASHPHNNYLSCLDFGGLVVFSLYYSIFVLILRRFLFKKNRTSNDVFVFGSICTILFTDYFATTFNIIVFPSFIAISYYQLRCINR